VVQSSSGHIRTSTGLAPTTSAPGPAGHTTTTSAPGPGLTPGTSDRAHPLRRRAARGGRHTGHCALQCSAERPMVGGTRRWLAPGRTRQASQPKSTLVFQKPSLPHTRHSLRPPLLAPSDLDVPAKPVRRRGTPLRRKRNFRPETSVRKVPPETSALAVHSGPLRAFAGQARLKGKYAACRVVC
jgi:hypothetical protein